MDVEFISLDTSDVDRWIGRPLGGGQLKESVHINDIRRWAQGMQNPNPLHFDEKFAAQSAYGRLVAPQSFAICCDCGHGATPAIQGRVPGSHMLFGGDEWWFFGPHIEAGDRLRSERLAYDYKVTNTRFAGPTMFQRGDTTYINQRGELVARQRSTSIRYIVENAHKLNSMKDLEQEPVWTDEGLEKLTQQKMRYYKSFQGHVRRTAGDVKVGEALLTGVIGPHSLQSFTTEWRSYLMTVWGSSEFDGLATSTSDAGWLPEMSRDPEKVSVDPAHGDGLYHGASRGHVQERYARLIGMPRAYGYGASMGAWVLDYVTNWAGQLGFVVHSNVQYRNPALAGDATFLNGKVTGSNAVPGQNAALVTIAVEMSTQTGATMAKGTVEVKLPLS